MNLLDTKDYIENFLWIRTKSGELKLLQLNPAQNKLYRALQEQNKAGKPMRAIILKARQLGFSTFTEAMIFMRAATRFNTRSLIMAHLDTSTAGLFRMEKLFYDCLPPELRPMMKKSNDAELLFENPSRSQKERDKNPGLRSSIACNTAGAGNGIGRGDTIQQLHCSELAFWRGNKAETLLGATQAVPSEEGTLIIIESTANGFEEFQKLWAAAVKGENDYVPIFCAWFEDAEYRKPVSPGTVWTEKELKLKSDYSLDDEQLAWRRWCIKNNCQGDERKFRQEYPSNPDEAFLTTGTGVFDNEIVMERKNHAPKPISVGIFAYGYDGLKITNIRWVERENGPIKIFADKAPNDWDFRPEPRIPYVLAGDTAGDGSDSFTGQVLDNTDGKQAAVLKMDSDEIEYTRQMYCLGAWYNWALIGIESNFTTYPQRELERLNYPNFYQRERYDTMTHQLQKAYGFRTDSKTRPVIISNLKEIFEASPELVLDEDTLAEMLVFIKNEAGRAQAAEGEHDDLVMALAIAHGIREQQRCTVREAPEERKEKLNKILEKKRKRR